MKNKLKWIGIVLAVFVAASLLSLYDESNQLGIEEHRNRLAIA